MSITIELEGSRQVVGSVLLDQDGDRFALLPGGRAEELDVRGAYCYVDNPLHVPPKDADLNDYAIALFIHPQWPESRVISIRDGNGLYLGLAFSLEAVGRGAQSLTGDEFENAFGFFALQQLCLGNAIAPSILKKCEPGDTYSITDFYPANTVVVVCLEQLWRKSFPSIQTYRDLINATLPSLALKGLRLSSAAGASGSDQREIGDHPEAGERSRWELRTISNEFPEGPRDFLLRLISEDPFGHHPAFRFFLVYQVFELLMQDLYERYLTQFRQATQLSDYDNPISMRELIEALKDALSEKSRMRAILESSPSALSFARQVQSQCTVILLQLGHQHEDDPSSAIYKVRNLLFHSFNELEASGADLSGLVDDIMTYVCELSLRYKAPQVCLRGVSQPVAQAGA